MKLFKKVMSVLTLLFVVFAMSGCAQILGKLLNKGEEELEEQYNNTPDPETPSITTESENDFTVYYGEPITLKVKAGVEDNGVLTYQWYSSSSNDRDSATPITGTNEAEKLSVKTPIYATLAPAEPAQDGVVTYYWCKVTNTDIKSGKNVDSWSDVYSVKVSNLIYVESISVKTDWEKRFTYVVFKDIDVSAKLTIPEGTVVKFTEDSAISTRTGGTINAKGVVFTSYRDNSAGITIPASIGLSPEPGDWEGIVIGETTGSTFDSCIIRYAGSQYNGALYLESKTTVKDCTFTNNKTPDDYIGALNISSSAISSTVTGNVFYNNEWPLSCPSTFTVDSSNVFQKEIDEEILKNKYQAIVMSVNEYITAGTVTWGKTGIPYLMKCGNLHITETGKLKIGDNVIIRFWQGCALSVYVSNGLSLGNGCILTSWRDDANGGDIFADGIDSGDDEGDWEGIWVDGKDWNNDYNSSSNVKFTVSHD